MAPLFGPLFAPLLGLALFLASGARGDTTLYLPSGAQETALDQRRGAVAFPTGPFSPTAQPSERVEGEILTRAWRVPAEQADPFRALRLIRLGLDEQGFEVRFACASDACGGFDFRFGIRVLPPPEMRVDLAAFHYLGAEHPDSGVRVMALTSRTAAHGFIQITEVSPMAEPAAAPARPAVAPALPAGPGLAGGWAASLASTGRAVLEGVAFASGRSTLTEGSADELAALAAFLTERPELSLAIVGHTDTVGGFEGNLALSRARAAAVRDRLIATHGIAPGRLTARGVAYLSPRASNETEAGRAQNRRVEIVVE